MKYSTSRRRRTTLEWHAKNREQGKRGSGCIPFGYDVRYGRLFENPAQMKAIERMRELRRAGTSFRAIKAVIHAEHGFCVSAFGIQRIVDNIRKINAAVIRQQSEKPMNRYTILVTVDAKSQGEAFAFVEQAIERDLDNEAYLKGVNKDEWKAHGNVQVHTPDGTKSVVF